uniref:Reticulon domain-containing protein n=1 Tax=Setaria viridis TaxID=4556 RepID=A0A4U6U0V8_SETVI|nr:3beta-hydroxysteroid-dehydrogenase/decarboxylase-like [Setaria viridis]TKW03667.1 hypothetical protein SEVIR_7G055809v2 [Setaria viridis]
MSDFTYVENVAHANICAEQALCSNAASVAGKVFAFLYSIKLLSNFQFIFLMGLVLASLFIVFIVYEQCEEEIDGLVSNASFKIKWLMDRVVERMPASLKAYIS